MQFGGKRGPPTGRLFMSWYTDTNGNSAAVSFSICYCVCVNDCFSDKRVCVHIRYFAESIPAIFTDFHFSQSSIRIHTAHLIQNIFLFYLIKMHINIYIYICIYMHFYCFIIYE